jgi:hypothetical protein
MFLIFTYHRGVVADENTEIRQARICKGIKLLRYLCLMIDSLIGAFKVEEGI